jgi:hypothetical protein
MDMLGVEGLHESREALARSMAAKDDSADEVPLLFKRVKQRPQCHLTALLAIGVFLVLLVGLILSGG